MNSVSRKLLDYHWHMLHGPNGPKHTAARDIMGILDEATHGAANDMGLYDYGFLGNFLYGW